MASAVSNNISALTAIGKQMAVSANNTANSLTEGFRKSRALLVEGQNNSVQVEISRAGEALSAIQAQDGQEDTAGQNGLLEGGAPSDVEYVEEAVTMVTAQRAFEANIKALQAYDEMTKTVVDIIG